ncbi:MAG: saccharopine dehydrogenase NADP-binding domain-containing protein [Pseudomonadota bacterium]
MPTIMILGGYGAVGFYITRYLLQETNVNLIIAGRSKLKAASVASQLSGLNNAAQERVNSMGVDAISHDSLRQAFSKIDAIVVAAPVMEHFTNIVDIAIESGTDCIDLVHTPNKYTYLQSKSVQITEAGCCFVTDVGLYPGIPGILARYALNQKPDATSIRIAILSRPDWAGLAISDELAREQLLASRDVKPGVHKRGKPRSRWRLGGGSKRIDFGEVFGVQSCAPVQLKELEDISAFGQVREVSVWEGGFDSLLATTILPCARLHQRFKPSAQLTLWANGLRSLLSSNLSFVILSAVFISQ